MIYLVGANCKHGVHMHCLAIGVGISKISKSMRPHCFLYDVDFVRVPDMTSTLQT